MRFLSVLQHTVLSSRKALLAVGLLLGALATVLALLAPGPMRQLDRMSYDLMLRRLGEKPPHPDVLIVDVDEASLARYGQWPWPRHLVARLLHLIRDHDPGAVGIDILFAEADRSSLKFINKALEAAATAQLDLSNVPPEVVDHDWALARTLHRGSFCLGMMFRFGETSAAKGELPNSTVRFTHVSRDGAAAPSFSPAQGVVAPIPVLAQATDGLGFVNAVPDADGVIRRLPVLVRYGDALHPSLALATFMRSRKSDAVIIESDSQGVATIKAGDALVPVDRQGFVALRFRGPSKTYPFISAADVLDNTISPNVFNKKIVLVGSSAEGLKDFHATPFDRRFSGVEVHATMVGSVLDHDFISVPTWSTGAQGAGALFAALLALVIVLRRSTWATGLAMVAFLLAVPASAMAIFEKCQVFISPVPTMLVFVVSFVLLALTRFRSEELRVLHRERQLAAARDCAIVGWASLAETRDTETGNHIFRTQNYMRAMAQHLVHHHNPEYRIQPKEVDLLFKSSPLHDVGKVGVPDAILLKPGPLSPAEFEQMKKHTLYGAEALAKAESASGLTDETSFLKIAREIALTHHEKWDGTGYPHGLEGKNIPLSGRLMALADVYDALISDRVYKKAMSHEAASRIIHQGRNTHFDPEIVDLFAALEHEFLAISMQHADKPARLDRIDQPQGTMNIGASVR